jgi:hypothetical protein
MMGVQNMRVARAGVFWGALLFLVACDPSGQPGGKSTFQDPELVFSGLESRLLESQETSLDFHVTAEGAIEIDLQGSLSMGPGQNVRLAAFGDFGGEEVDLRLVSDGSSYEFGRAPSLFSGPTPRELKDAILIGFTRMGILHNLAMLSAGAPPDRSDGGVRDWAVSHEFSFVPKEAPEEETTTVEFSITVDGVPSGTASLELDGEGMPILRRQTVKFPDGEMRVLERYRTVTIRP